MKVIPAVMIVCLFGMGYGYWGAFTQSGQVYYDEMDAMTPFFALVFFAFLFIVLLVVMVVQKIRSKG